jgi:inosine-uridine nucleoside N-ribohydrolase
LRLHLDTDIGGDIDDLCALAMVLNIPGTELAAVTTVSEIGGKRAGYARFVLDLAGRHNVPVAPGADVSVRCYRHWQPGVHRDEHAYWPQNVQPITGSEGAALTLLERSIKEGIAIAAIGPYTNLALLERRSPGILADAKLVLMGGFVFPPREGFPQWQREMDYNVQVDPESALVVFEQSDPVLVPLAVTVETALRRVWLPSLNGAGSIGKLVARQAEAFQVEEPFESRLVGNCDALPNDIINFLHDPLACAIALDWDEGVVIRQLPLRSEMHDGYVFQTHDAGGKPTRVVTEVDGPSFSEYWLKTVCANGIEEDRC